jgi:hypothetical protein
MNCKYCAHRRTCETLLHDDDYCADYRASCPLPRIGSKDWGWDLWCSSDREDFYAAKDHEANYAVRQDETNTFPYAVVNKANRTSVAIFRGRDEAFRFAELLARRDWRKANRHG